MPHPGCGRPTPGPAQREGGGVHSAAEQDVRPLSTSPVFCGSLSDPHPLLAPVQQICVSRRGGRREQPVGRAGGRLHQQGVGRGSAVGRGRPVPRPARRITCAGDPTQGGQGCGGNGASSSASGRRRQSQGEWRTRVTARRRRERRQGEWGASLTAQGRCEGKGGAASGASAGSGCGAPNQHQG